MMATPPPWARRLLSVRVPPPDRDEVIGDLDEEFLEVVEAQGRGRARAWYWRHAVRLAWALGGGAPNRGGGASLSSRVMFDELRYAARRLRKQPATSISSIVTLALAIGAAVATWSVLSAVLLRPLPQVRTANLVTVGTRSTEAPATTPFIYLRHTHLAFRSMRDSAVFERLAAVGRWPSDVRVGDVSGSMSVGFVTPDYFKVLGLRLHAGRGFLAEDARPDAPPVAIVSHHFWRRVMGADPAAVGRLIVIGGHAVTVVGIAPEGFIGLSLSGDPMNLYVPIHTVAELTGNRSNWLSDPGRTATSPSWLQVVGRLRSEARPDQAEARLASQVPEAVQQIPVGEGTERALYAVTDLASTAVAAKVEVAGFARLLAITVALLLLIGCFTVGMLVLLRTEARRDEFALCLALGGSRARLAGGVLAEAALLSAGGAALALPIGLWLIEGVRAFGLPGRIRIEWLQLSLDWRMLAAAVAAAAVATLLMALIASVFGLSANVADALRARAGVTARVGRHRTRAALAVAQMAVALVLLAGAGLLARSLSAALSLNPGYDIAHIADGTVSTVSAKYTPERARAFFADVQERLSRDGRIRSVSLSQFKGGGDSVMVDGEDRKMPRTYRYYDVDEHYFRTLGLPLNGGRDFTPHDRLTGAPVAIVNASFGRVLANGGNPVGRRVRFGMGPGVKPIDFEIVGVVPDVILSVGSLEPLVLYRPLSDRDGTLTSATVMLHADGDPAGVMRDVQTTIRAMDPAVTVPEFLTIERKLLRQMEPQQFGVTVLGALGGLAALLTLFGMYVLAESMSAARRREISVRAALGATRGELCTLVLSQTTRLVVLGIGSGLVLVWLGAGLIKTLLYGVEPLDVPTISAVVALLFALAMVVTVRPALRAAEVDLARLLKE